MVAEGGSSGGNESSESTLSSTPKDTNSFIDTPIDLPEAAYAFTPQIFSLGWKAEYAGFGLQTRDFSAYNVDKGDGKFYDGYDNFVALDKGNIIEYIGTYIRRQWYITGYSSAECYTGYMLEEIDKSKLGESGIQETETLFTLCPLESSKNSEIEDLNTSVPETSATSSFAFEMPSDSTVCRLSEVDYYVLGSAWSGDLDPEYSYDANGMEEEQCSLRNLQYLKSDSITITNIVTQSKSKDAYEEFTLDEEATRDLATGITTLKGTHSIHGSYECYYQTAINEILPAIFDEQSSNNIGDVIYAPHTLPGASEYVDSNNTFPIIETNCKDWRFDYNVKATFLFAQTSTKYNISDSSGDVHYLRYDYFYDKDTGDEYH